MLPWSWPTDIGLKHKWGIMKRSRTFRPSRLMKLSVNKNAVFTLWGNWKYHTASLFLRCFDVEIILRDPAAVRGCREKSKWVRKKLGPNFFLARLDFSRPSLTAPGSPRMRSSVNCIKLFGCVYWELLRRWDLLWMVIIMWSFIDVWMLFKMLKFLP